ncbi:hypothetical protein BJ138DRAFT_1055011 [Hygrophoropsis aurantiaca]|uniref:Uncharacterized protein n=1 Tax=Hygrophoropsis aurantiaca TaxID=72124 RepID=A0ACB8AQU6_9AGAM|nr:hypothetical protein BJ138DRAFT_1055011 [Hygrophoropsis aurantiaca]
MIAGAPTKQPFHDTINPSHRQLEVKPAYSPSINVHYPVITPRAVEPQPNEVVIELSTSVSIPDYNKYYPNTPIDSFVPVYFALDDGSLVAPPFIHDVQLSYSSLIVGVVILMIFLRNIIVSAGYIWRGNIKKKGLLYTLFLSQIFGPSALIPMVVVQFHRSMQCSVVIRISGMSAGLSLSLLITGIFGVKAYRCLDNTRFILIPLLALRTASLILLVLDTIQVDGARSLSGMYCRCSRVSNGYEPAFIILMFVESFFVCFCFLYAVWKSHGSAAVRGRISLTLSLEDVGMKEETEIKEIVASHHSPSPRAWWDHTPTLESAAFSARSRQRVESIVSPERSIISVVRDHPPTTQDSHIESHPGVTFPRQSSTNEESNRSRRPRASTVKMSETMEVPSMTRRDDILPFRPASPAFSSLSRITRYIPRMMLFREVMRDELCYTAFITSFTVVCIVLALAGVNSNIDVSSMAWIGFDWTIISCLAMHSFSRVIRRHENEALRQRPDAWNHTIYTDRSTAELLRDRRSRLPRSSGALSSRMRTRPVVPNSRRDDLSESIHDSSLRHLYPSQGFWSSGGDARSVAASTQASAASNLFPPVQTVESFPRIHEHSIHTIVSSPSGRSSWMSHQCDLEITPSRPVSTSADLSDHWYDNTGQPVCLDPVDAEGSFHSLSHDS